MFLHEVFEVHTGHLFHKSAYTVSTRTVAPIRARLEGQTMQRIARNSRFESTKWNAIRRDLLHKRLNHGGIACASAMR